MSINLPILRDIAADSSLALILKVISLPLVYLTQLIIARCYGAANMGTYFIALSLVITFSVICTLGLNSGLLRFVSILKAEEQAGDIKRLFWQAIGMVSFVSGVTAMGLYFSGDWLTAWFHAPNLSSLIGIMAVALPVTVLISLTGETVRALGGARWVVLQIHLILPGSFLLMVGVFFYAGHGWYGGLQALGLAFLISSLISLAFLFLCPSSLVRYGKGKPERNLTKELLLYSWPLFLNSIFWLSLSGIDSLILGLFTSPEDVAYYGVAAKIAPLIAVPLGAVNAVVPPLIAQYNQAGEFKSLEQVAQTTARWMYLLSLPLTIIIILLAPNLLGLFGANFLKAQFALTVLSLGQIVNVSAGSVGLILALTGSQWFLIKGQLLVGTVTIPLMIFLGKSFGISGVALASAFGLAGINVFMAWAVWRRLGIKGFVLKTRWANLGAGVGLIFFFLTKPYAGQIGGTICFALGYLAIVGKKLKEEFAGILQASHGIGATL